MRAIIVGVFCCAASAAFAQDPMGSWPDPGGPTFNTFSANGVRVWSPKPPPVPPMPQVVVVPIQRQTVVIENEVNAGRAWHRNGSPAFHGSRRRW
jgi:hypothetical protein